MDDSRKLYQMLDLQDNLNTYTGGKDWVKGVTNLGREINWERCIYMEAAELMDSFNWRHWKGVDKPDDIDNARMEAVDIFHFVMSLAIESNDEPALVGVFLNKKTTHVPMETNIEALIMSAIIHSYEMEVNYESLNNIYTCLFSIFYGLEMSLDDIYRLYVIKNILNKFRQDHGYKEGTYHKIWKGKEDNEVAQMVWEDGLSPDDFYALLEKHYPKV